MGGWNGTEKAAPYLRDGLGFWERQQDALGREPFSDKVKKKKKKKKYPANFRRESNKWEVNKKESDLGYNSPQLLVTLTRSLCSQALVPLCPEQGARCTWQGLCR